MAVLVLDRRKQPVMPCSEKRARILLARGRARVHRLKPFTIRLVDRLRENSVLQPVAVKIDPGSKTTGIALIRENDSGEQAVLHLLELAHRGKQISEALTRRAALRRARRGRKTRYRAPRSDNRTKPAGWLAPSLRHRVITTMTWIGRLRRWTPVTRIVMERVRFDTQLLQDPAIAGAGYQQGTLAGYETREYLLEKGRRTCAYCDATNILLEIEHIAPRSRGGSDRVSNLTLACRTCNRNKGSLPVETFVQDAARLRRILAQAKAPLRDAAAMNATRNALHRALVSTGLPVETGSGGLTKFNRCRLDIPKTHALDAACCGITPSLASWRRPTLAIACTGRGRHQRVRCDAYGFARGHSMRTKAVHGFRTGDFVRAVVPDGKNAGTHTGRVAVRATGSFNIGTRTGMIQGIRWKRCALLQRADGYGYDHTPSPQQEPTGSAPA